MAAVDAWDVHLEAITAALCARFDGKARGRVNLETTAGWGAEFYARGRTVSASLRHRDGVGNMPGDYALAVIYGCDYSPMGDEARPSGFAKSLTVREGFGWDEQMLRDLVLEVLGLLRYALGAGAAADAKVDARTTEPSATAVRRRRSDSGQEKR
ncbi:MAG: hypothetical protein AB7T37_14175 [Dehalococcoidia bacterium]